MTKSEFFERLKELLSDLPQEECEEAIWYYEDYFADAGVEREDEVLRELGSAENVAEKIRAGYLRQDQANESDAFAENMFSGIKPETEFAENAYAQEERMRREEEDAGRYEDNSHYEKEQSYRGHGATVHTKNYLSPLVTIVLLLIGIFVAGPIFLAFACIMVGFFAGFGAAGVGMIAGGVAMIGSALSDVSIGSGLVCVISGGGLILTAIGIAFVVFAVNCAFRALPGAFRKVSAVFFHRTNRQRA